RNGAQLERGFRRLAPWSTRYVLNGVEYGGDYDPATDARTGRFWAAFPEARTVLELGAVEGGLSFELARRPGVQVTAVESRADNVAKARFVQRALGVDNVRFHHADLEVVPPSAFGRHDA